MANAQLLSPEIVTGYLMIFHSNEDTGRRRDGTQRVDFSGMQSNGSRAETPMHGHLG